MPEYTYKDIIIDPTSEEAKNCIGKVVYYSDNPTECLCYANKNNTVYCGTLKKIDTSRRYPFISGINTDNWGCIILKKEEPNHEYIPFESADEFLDAYEDSTYRIACDSVENKLLNRGGIWLKHEYIDFFDYYNVTEIRSKVGLVIGGDTDATCWNRLLKIYKFLDGTPCGKIKE